MSICVNCGNSAESCLCDRCRETVNIEELCDRLTRYMPGTGQNILWDSMSSDLNSPYNFRNVVFSIADCLPSPRKEYRRILGLVGDSNAIGKTAGHGFMKSSIYAGTTKAYLNMN